MCTASTQVFEHPLDALIGTPWPKSPETYGFDDNPCREWPSAWETWLTLWGPILLVLLTTGALAVRVGTSASAARGAFASGAVAAVAMLMVHLPEQFAVGTISAVWLGAALLGAVAGFIGGYFLTRGTLPREASGSRD